MANSDIIKIGFDYRASLAQFEKETNGVFDGISTKAGKQKITIQLDAKDDKVIDKIKELQKLKLDKFTFEFGDSGLKEQLQTFDKLENKINEIINLGKGIGSAINGARNSIVDEKYLKTVIDLFSKIENHTSTIKKAFSDVGDGEELSPLLKTISNIESAIDKLSSSVKGIGLNMNIDIGSDKEMEAKAQAKISNALQAYKNLFEHIKMSSVGGSIITQKFFDFDINQFDTPMSKLQAYIKFIKDMREETKQMFGGQDVLKTDTDAKYWTQASSAMGLVTKVFNEMKTASDVNPLENIFGKTDLSSVIEQLNTIVSKLDEISVSAKGFTETFKNGLNINASVEEIEKLTNRVKELESELAKIKTPTAVTTPQESNISSGMKDAFPDKDVSASVESATNSIKEENTVLEQNTQKVKENTQAKKENTNANLNKYDKRLDSYNGKITKYKTTIDRLKDGGWASDAYEKNVNAVEKAVDKYETLLNELKNKDASLVTNKDIEKLNEYESAIKKTIATVTNMSAAEKGYNAVSGQKELDKIHKLLNENSKMSSMAKAQIKAYYKEIESGNPSMSLDKIHTEIMKIVNAEVEAGRGGKNMWSAIKEKAWYGMASAIGTYFGFNDIIRYGQQVASIVTDINTQITELVKVSEQSSSQIYADFDSYADIAKEVRGTISDTIAATADWSKNGYSIPDAKQLAEVSQLYKNVGDGIDIDTANESLISTLKGFQLEADQAEHIVDVFNEVDILASYYSNVIALCV